MDLVRPALEREVDDRSCRMSGLRVERIGLDLELGNRV